MLKPYVNSSLDDEFLSLSEDALVQEDFIALQLVDVTARLYDAGADASSEIVQNLHNELKLLASEYLELRSVYTRMRVLAENAKVSQKSILGYHPDEVGILASARESQFTSISENLQSAITQTFSQKELLEKASGSLRLAAVLGEAVGPVYDAVTVINDFSEGNDYAGFAGAISGIAGVLIGVATASAVTSSSLPFALAIGVGTGTFTTILGGVIEDYLVEYDVLDIDELTPAVNNLSAVKKLSDMHELLASLDSTLASDTKFSLLDASSGVVGEHINSLFDMIRYYFDGGAQFTEMSELSKAIREDNFQNERKGFDLIDLSSRSIEELVLLSKKSDETGQSVRYALMNMVPFALNSIEGTTANDSDYSLDKFSDQFLFDRAKMLVGYLDGLSDESVSALHVEGGVRVFSDTPFMEPYLDIIDLKKDILLTNFIVSADSATIIFGINGKEDVIEGYGGDDHLYGMSGEDTLSGLKGDDYLEGGRGNDTLKGGAGIDYLYGGKGNDTLEGGEDDDFLTGGQGSDTYVFKSGDDSDTISDGVGNNRLKINDHYISNLEETHAGSGIYQDKNAVGTLPDKTTYTFDGEDLVVNVGGAGTGDVIRIITYNKETNDFGLTFDELPQTLEV